MANDDVPKSPGDNGVALEGDDVTVVQRSAFDTLSYKCQGRQAAGPTTATWIFSSELYLHLPFPLFSSLCCLVVGRSVNVSPHSLGPPIRI